MKHYHPILLAISLMLGISGCAHVTPINQLPLPPVTVIEGTVTQLTDNGFMLKDATGEILVKAQLPNTGNSQPPLNILTNEKVRVYGNLQGGTAKIFDGYVIRKTTGQQIIVTNPTPHIGFIIQSRFKP